MRITGDYHTHTLYSHGKGTVAQSVAAAAQLGLKTIAISEHGPGHVLFGVSKEKLKALKAEIVALRADYPDLHIKFGLEANIMSPEGDLDVDDELVGMLDFLMAGYHFGSTPKRFFRDSTWHLANVLVRYLPFLKGYCIEKNTQAAVKAIERFPLFALTHPGAKGPIDVAKVAQAAFRRGTLLEINAHHGHLTEAAIRIAKRNHVRFIINSDAHQPDHIGRVAPGVERAIKAGLTAEDVFNAELE